MLMLDDGVDLAPGEAEAYDPGTNEEYHAGPGVSSTRIRDFADDRWEFAAQYVFNTKPRKPPSKEMKLGTCAHEILLEGGLQSVIEIPADVLNDKGHKKGKPYTDFVKANAGHELLTRAELADAHSMVAEVRGNPNANLLLEAELKEFAIRWRHPESGLLIRAKLDAVEDLGAFVSVVDLKTTKDVEATEFAKACQPFWREGRNGKQHKVSGTFWYYAQEAIYRKLAEVFFEKRSRFHWFAVRNNPAFDSRVFSSAPGMAEQASYDVFRDGGILCQMADLLPCGIDEWRDRAYRDVTVLPF